MSNTTVNNWVNGYKMPRMDKIDRICQFLNINRSDLLEETKIGTVVKAVRIPILGSIVAGTPIDAIENIEDYENISSHLASNGQHYALRVQGASMEPEIWENDIVIVEQTNSIESGDIAVVLINGNEATIKKVVINDNGLTLIGFNVAVYEPHYYSAFDIEKLPLKIIGKVVESHRKF